MFVQTLAWKNTEEVPKIVSNIIQGEVMRGKQQVAGDDSSVDDATSRILTQKFKKEETKMRKYLVTMLMMLAFAVMFNVRRGLDSPKFVAKEPDYTRRI